MKFCPTCDARLKKDNNTSLLTCPKCNYTEGGPKDKKKSVTEKKKDNITATGETTIPFPVITKKDSGGDIVPVPVGSGNGSGSSSSSMMPLDDGLNSSLTDLFLGRL